METLARSEKMLLDVAPNGAGRIYEGRGYKDSAPTELAYATFGLFRVLHVRGLTIAE